jgi:hypothetical protein
MTTKTKISKTTKTTKTVAKAAPTANRAMAKVYKVRKQFDRNEGVLLDFVRAIPKSGAPLATIAKKAKVPASKARSYAYHLVSTGFLTRAA